MIPLVFLVGGSSIDSTLPGEPHEVFLTVGKLDISIKKRRREVEPTADSRAQRAYLILRERILLADYPFGTILSPRQLATRFGMSLIPVAEALQRLEYEGLVERRPRAGTRVRIPTPEDVRGLYVIREALESQAARLCSVHATAAERVELRTLAAELDRHFSGNGAVDSKTHLHDIHRRHVQLHTRIAECAHCHTLSQAIERNHVLHLKFLYDVAAQRTVLPPGFHADLVEPILRGDPERADAMMRAHVKYGFSETLQQLEPQIQQNGWRLGKNDDSSGVRRKVRTSRTARRNASTRKSG